MLDTRRKMPRNKFGFIKVIVYIYIMKICGIYTITNLINNKLYIGYSDNIKLRFSQHLSSLKLNKHDNEYLQKSFNKYGIENFKFEILEECLSIYLTSQENYWVNLLNTNNRDFGYNIQSTRPDEKMTINKETRLKISNKNKKKPISEKTRQAVIKYHKDFPLTKEHKDKLATARKLVTISDEGRQRITEGRRLKSKPMSLETKEKLRQCNLGKKRPFIKKSKKFNRKGLEIEQFTLNGIFIQSFIRITDVEKIGFNADMVIKVCKGIKKSYKKYIWKYKNGNSMVK